MSPATRAATDASPVTDDANTGNGSVVSREASLRLARFLKTRDKMLDRARSIKTGQPVRVPDAVAQAIGTEGAAALAAGTPVSRDWRAIRNRDEVVRMSLAGAPVAEIAAALDLSYGHVVALRARLRVGRER